MPTTDVTSLCIYVGNDVADEKNELMCFLNIMNDVHRNTYFAHQIGFRLVVLVNLAYAICLLLTSNSYASLLSSHASCGFGASLFFVVVAVIDTIMSNIRVTCCRITLVMVLLCVAYSAQFDDTHTHTHTHTRTHIRKYS